MRGWHIFALGTLALVTAILLPLYHASLAACGALVIVAVVACGFMLRPYPEVFYLRTTNSGYDFEGRVFVDHDRIAVRVELTRLWILFIPTLLAVVFLALTWAEDTNLNVNFLDAIQANSFSMLLFWRIGFLGLVGLNAILSAWTSERWILRNAKACSARSLTLKAGRISYAFTDENAEFYGGETFVLARGYTPQIASIVVYKESKPNLNKIAVGCLFHRFVVIGHGITEFDENTVSGSLQVAQTTG